MMVHTSSAPERQLVENKREILGWTMYDWANSAFVTTVLTAFLGPYLGSLAEAQGGVNIFGFILKADAFWPTCGAIAVILQVLLLPILGAIADYSNLKKRMMMVFAYVGAGATIALFLVQGDLVILGGLLFIIANLSFGAAIVFYNAFLPEIVHPEARDSVSSRGFAIGYLGGGLLLLANLVLYNIMNANGQGILAVRISLASAGVWWLFFTYIFPQRLLIQRRPSRSLPEGENYLSQGIKQLWKTSIELKNDYPMSLRFLIAYLVYNDGIQTVILVATSFASSELGVEPGTLIILVLLIQFLAVGGALFFERIARQIGTKRAIMASLVVWAAIVIFAFSFLYEEWQLWILGVAVAMVLGGSQALSRSLFSQMIPTSREAEYFGFYEISERGTSWIGPLVFAIVIQLTGAQRLAIVSLIVFFVGGLLLLSRVNIRQAVLEAGHDPDRVTY